MEKLCVLTLSPVTLPCLGKIEATLLASIFQTSKVPGETSDGVAKCRLFSQAIHKLTYFHYPGTAQQVFEWGG